MSELGIRSIDNLDILYEDLDVMFEFYHGTLGLPLLFPRQPEDDWFAVQVGGISVYFFPGVGRHAPPFHADSDLNPPALESLAFEVDDLDHAVSTLDSHVDWTSGTERWEHPSGTWYRFRYFLDPEGNKLGIVEPHKAD